MQLKFVPQNGFVIILNDELTKINEHLLWVDSFTIETNRQLQSVDKNKSSFVYANL